MADKIDDWLETGRNGFTDEQIKAQFQKVRNKEHWKLDIEAEIEPGEESLTETAIRWFTGPAEIWFSQSGDKVLVRATGYWTNGMDG